MRATFEDIFKEFKVDLYIAGHKHFYERFFPTYKETVVQKDYNNLDVPF